MSPAPPGSTAFIDLVSDSTRRSILRALADAHAEAPTNPWLAYSDLRDAVGVRDKGNFNYHLDRLDDLIDSGEEGYRLSRVGMAVVSTLASGRFDTGWTWGPVDAPGACYRCGDSLELRYDDGILRVTCGDENHATPLSVWPSLLAGPDDDGHKADDWGSDEVVERIALLTNRYGEELRHGICADCHGRVDPAVEPHPEEDCYHVAGRCERCGFAHGTYVGASLIRHPAVVAFAHEHGVEVRTRPWWTFDWCAPGSETVTGTDPLRLRIDVEFGSEELSLVVDDEGAVVSTARP